MYQQIKQTKHGTPTFVQTTHYVFSNGTWSTVLNLIKAAICAAPSKVLSPLNLLNGSPCTGYPSPSFNELIEKNGGILSSDDVVYCPKNNLITSKGPATAMMFGLTVGEYLFGEEKAGEIAGELLMLEEGEE